MKRILIPILLIVCLAPAVILGVFQIYQTRNLVQENAGRYLELAQADGARSLAAYFQTLGRGIL